MFFITILFGIFMLASYFYNLPIKKDNLVISGVVIKLDEESFVLSSNGKKYLVYHKGSFELGDKLIIKIKKIKYNNELFNYEEYLINQGINGPYELIKYKINGNRFVLAKINNYFIKKVDNHQSEYRGYIKSLVFSDSSGVTDIKDKTTKIGVSHILAVSGMHISLLILIAEFLLKKVFYFEKAIDISVVVFLFSYIIITNFSLTVLRASLMVILAKIFKIYKLLFTKLDILSIVGIILLLINPKTLYLLSFELSFLVSFIIIIFISNIKIENKMISMYFICIISFLVGLPLVINVNYEFNLLSIILGPFYVLYFELILYPSTLIMFLIPKISVIFNPVFQFFEYFTTHFSNINDFNIIVGKVSLIIILLYYVLLFFLLSSFEIKRFRKYTIMIFVLFLLFIYNKASFNPFLEVKIYNVGQGDSILISLPKGEGYILFDSYNNVSDYLKSDGIRDIDVMFLTHGHTDHINSYPDLLENFNVKNSYTSYYDDTILLKEYKKKYNIKLIKSGDVVKFKNAIFDVLGPVKYYSNENNNSLVVKFIYNDLSILFTGDIEIDAELDLTLKYQNYLSCDILKVAHHGSKSSSSELFLSYVKPKYYVISVGLNNFYDLPNNRLILEKKNLYRTDVNGTISFYYYKKLKINTVFRWFYYFVVVQ